MLPNAKSPKKKNKFYSKQDLLHAFDAIEAGMSIGAASRKYGIPKSTLSDKMSKKIKEKLYLKLQKKNVHVNIKEFECEECHKQYFEKRHLELHKRNVHEKNKIKGFECEECHQHFLVKSHLKAHMKSVHLNNKSDVCHKQYMEKDSLDHHKPETSGIDG